MQSNEKSRCLNGNIEYVKSEIPSEVRNAFYSFRSNSEIFLKRSSDNMNSQLCTTKVHVNPNFKSKYTTVYINPNICTKPLIHINPKIIRDIANSNQNLQNNIANVNSTTMNITNMNIAKTNIDNNIKQINIKKSIYINPTLLNKLSSSSKESTNSKEVIEQPVCSKLKFVKNTDNQKNSLKKNNNSKIVLLSHRKLVRVSDNIKNSSRIQISQYRLQKSVNLMDKTSETVLQKMKAKLLVNNTLHSMNMKSNLAKLGINRSSNKSKVTKYKIDRTTLSTRKARKALLLKKITNNNVRGNNNKHTSKFITIGGIVYKSSKNKLIRNNCSLKRKNSFSVKNDKFNIDKRARILKESLNRTSEVNKNKRFSFNIVIKANYKTSVSNKAKQRSIRILQNKMHKNNQPCLIFQRFGSCPNHENGICLKRHDKKQVSVCKKFLQGKCLLNKCLLSHDIGPEKMPTCKYFLDGCCTRDDCPYLHVKMSAKTSICIDFLQGYCAKGDKCQRRHEYFCPEFDKSENCSKGKSCPYPHKSSKIHLCENEKNAKYLNNTKKHQAITISKKNDSKTTNPESRRYYEINSLYEDPEEQSQKADIK
ncbi:hypothetical protein HN011_002860 [Eciton burchellii]|nr:hypothetical protein HN011_002860 [Eciton burchellii]